MKKFLTILTTISIVATCFASGFTVLAEGYEPAVTEAIVSDAVDAGRTVHGTYTVALDGTTVNIDMDELAYHQNGEGNMGYWTGFAVVAPDTAAKVKYTFGDTIDGVAAAEDIDQNGTMGVAFYTDAANPNTEVKLQWLDEEDNPLTEEITLTMDLADVNYYSAGEVVEAIIEDSDDAEATVCSDYNVTEAEGVVAITTTDLVKHTNGVATEGYWTGFAVKAPDAAATKVKYTFGDTIDGIVSVEDIDQNGTMGIAFYTDAGNINPNTEATIQWLNEAEEVLSAPVTYTIDLTNVALSYGDYTPVVTEAIIADSDNLGRTVCDAYTAELDGTTVDINTEGLAYHKSGEGEEGYWTGFAVEAPVGTAYGKYTFGESTGTALEDIDQNGTMGLAFYTDAIDPITQVELQWFDGNNSAITAPVTLTMNLADVNYYGVGVVEEAIIADSDDAESVVYSDYEVTEAEGIVAITTTDLVKHTNGVATEGYWTGFAVVAPDAAATKVKYTFGDTIDGIVSVEDIDQVGTMGIAFYTNAGNVAPNTEVTLQWLNEAEEVLSAPVTYTIDLTNVTLNTGYALEVTEAVVADGDDAAAVVYSDYEVTEAEGVVTITTTDLAKHTNGDVPPEEGYWTGFAVVAPDGAAYGKYTFGESTGIALEDIDQNGTMGLAFYTDAIDPVTQVELQWFDATDNALSDVITLEMVLDVTYEGAVDIVATDVVEAIIEDSEDAEAAVYSSYSVAATEEDGKIIVAVSNSGLKAHKNGAGDEGFWTGFAVVAPENAAYGKYTFGESTGTALEDIDQNGTMGIAFYTDVDDAVTEVTLQWFDENDDPVSNVAVFETDLSDVSKYIASTPHRGGSASAKYYTVTFETNGGNKISAVSVKENNILSKPADPKKEGFTFAGWYLDKELKTEYEFTSKVTKAFTLYAKWTENEAEEDTTTTKGFTDVAKDAWYYDVVTKAIEKGLMNGMSETEFAPQASLTRGMFVTILYRLAGEPEVAGECQFADIAADMYYTDAVIWASTNGIVNGITEDTFAPDNNITREQMATIIHRYAEYAKIEIEEGEDVTYTDNANISDYAKEAIKWTKWAGLLNGNEDGSFAPQRNSTRAEAAALFVRVLGIVE